MSRLRRWWVLYCKFGVPLALAILPALAIYGAFTPWQAADRVLQPYRDQVPVLVGASSKSSLVENNRELNWISTKFRSRSYVLLSTIFKSPTVVSVEQVNDNFPTSSVSQSKYFLVGLGLVYAFGISCIWRYWLRPSRP